VVQTDVSDSKTIWDHGLHGEGQILGHIDGRLDIDSCYFRDPSNNTPGPSHRKVVAYRSSIGIGADGHGTHTAGTLAGDRFPVDGTLINNGHAYAAKISHAALGDISGINNTASNLYNRLFQAFGDGARLHNNSWGDDAVTSYSTWARDIDLYSYDFEDALVVFAITNGGVLRSPENAKNVLAVGASDNGVSADSHCSGGTGPTPDGRRKPEIYAPGCGILSARSTFSCSTTSRTGTSMSAPAITSAGALVRQYFEEGWYPSGTKVPGDTVTPSAALVKAMLLNSTVDMTNVTGYPSNLEGWGRVLLENSLYFDGDLRNLALLADVRNAGGFTTGGSASYPVLVTGAEEELKVTLVFTDPAAPLLSLSPAINDLDLEVTSPSAELYRGNVFDSSAGVSITGGTADPINNVEIVRVVSPEIGLWTVTVNGTAVNQGSQGYALVATGRLDASGSGTVRYASHQIDDSGLLGDGDGVPDPGETITLPLTLLNQRQDPATSVSAKLFAGDPAQAKVTDPDADFPDMIATTAGTSLPPHYTLTLSPNITCGESVLFDVVTTHTDGQDDSFFTFQIGADVLESAADDVPLTIPSISAIPTTSTIQIGEALTIADVEVTVNIEHDDVGEMFIQLTSPNATLVVLHNHNDIGVADLNVTYPVDRLPDGPGALSDFAGESAAGAWTLSITDIAAGDPVTPAGTLVDWSLKLTFSDGIVCSPFDCAGDPVPPPVAPTMTTAKENGTDLRFSWSPVSGAAAYRIWRSATPDFAREELVAATTPTTHLELGGLTDGPDWYYRVNAVNSCEWESALDCGGDPLPREVAGTMTLGKESVTDLRFDWSAVSGASGYRVRRSDAADFVQSETVGESPTTSFTEPGGLNDPGNGFYLVRALNSCEWEGP
jgi:subtilisin-like proprotein convertase family protein